MFKEERQSEILKIVEDLKAISVENLARRFDVSILTIRRDLDVLSNMNLLQRAHGGAIAKTGSSITKEISFYEKQNINVLEKESIAMAVVKFINPNDVILIDGSTTNIRVARELRKYKDVKIITNSLNISLEISDSNNVVLLGGDVRPTSFNTVGPLVLKELENFYADKLILAIDGIDLNNGLTTVDLSESLVKRKMINRAKETIVNADSSKIGKVGPFRVAGLKDIKRIITDKNILPEYKKNIEMIGVEVITC